jgi:hypothetical protein
MPSLFLLQWTRLDFIYSGQFNSTCIQGRAMFFFFVDYGLLLLLLVMQKQLFISFLNATIKNLEWAWSKRLCVNV